LKKRFLSLILVLAMVLSLAPAMGLTVGAISPNWTLVVQGGSVYKNTVAPENILNPPGLTYDSGKDEWTMSDFEFATLAPVAIEFKDEAVTVNISGTNSVTGGLDSTAAGIGIKAEGIILRGSSTADKLTVKSNAPCSYGNKGISADELTAETMSLDIISGYEEVMGATSYGIIANSIVLNSVIANVTVADYQSVAIGYQDSLDVLGSAKVDLNCAFALVNTVRTSLEAEVPAPEEPNAVAKHNDTTLNWFSIAMGNSLDGYLGSGYYLDPDYEEEDVEMLGTLTLTAKNAVVCSYTQALTAGQYTLLLGGEEAGEYTLVGSNKNGYTLQNADGSYLAYENGALKADSEAAFTWKYDGGLYAETKTQTAAKASGRGGYFSWWYGPRRSSDVKVTKTYLTAQSGAAALSSSKVTAQLQVNAPQHTLAYNHDGDGCHEAYCTKCGFTDQPEAHTYDNGTGKCVCGKLNPDLCRVTAVTVTEKKTAACRGGWWYGWGRKAAAASYQYALQTKTENVCVKKVEYSLDEEQTDETVWKTGSCFTNAKQLDKLYIRVTDTLGHETLWLWDKAVDAVNAVQIIDEPEDQSALWWDYEELGSAENLESIAFDTLVPADYEEGENWYTWDTPASSKAYYDKVNHAVTYVLNEGSKFVFDNGSLFRSAPKTLTDEQLVEAINDTFSLDFADMDDVDAFMQTVEELDAAVENGDEQALRELITRQTVIDAFMAGTAYEYDVLEACGLLGEFPEYCQFYREGFPPILNGAVNFLYGVGVSEKDVIVTGLELFDVSAVTDFSGMFRRLCAQTLDVSGFDVSKGKNFSGMFYDCRKLESLDLKNWDTGSARDMSEMFAGCSGLSTLNVEGFNTAKVTDMSGMFSGCSGLSSLNVSGFHTDLVTDFSGMFSTIKLTALSISNFNTAKAENMQGMFRYCTELQSLDISSFDTGLVTDMRDMFGSCCALQTVTFGTGFNTSKVTDMRNMFKECGALTLTKTDLAKFDTAKVRNMSGMFNDCKMTSLDLSSFSTASATDLSYMFANNTKLQSVTFGANFTAANAKSLDNMFNTCTALTDLDISMFQTGSAADMSCMLRDCFNLVNLTLGDGFTGDSARRLDYLFYNCQKLSELDLSSFKTENAISMDYMFAACDGLTTLTLSDDFKTDNVTAMECMFSECGSLTELDLSFFNTAKVKKMTKMFYKCGKLTTIYVVDNWVTSSVTNSAEMFADCEGLNGYNAANTNDAEYACYSTVGGYLSKKAC